MIYKGNMANISYAVDVYNLLLDFGYIEMWLTQKDKYDYTEATGDELAIAHQIFKNSENSYVDGKYLWKPWHRNTLAYHSDGMLIINLKKISSFAGLVGTCAHENEHFFDHIIENMDFGHGSDSSVGKENTVPYYIGIQAKLFIQDLEAKGIDTPIKIISYLIETHLALQV